MVRGVSRTGVSRVNACETPDAFKRIFKKLVQEAAADSGVAQV